VFRKCFCDLISLKLKHSLVHGCEVVPVLLIARQLLQPFPDGCDAPGITDVSASFHSFVFTIDKTLERLCIVVPFNAAESVGDWHDVEGFEVEVTVETYGILLEDLVHYLEQLLDSLVQSEIFPTLDQQVVVSLVATVNGDAFWATVGAHHQDFFSDRRNFDVFAHYWLRHKGAFVLAWNLDIYFCVVEVIVIQVVEPLREFRELFTAALQV